MYCTVTMKTQNGGREEHTLVIWVSSDDKNIFLTKFDLPVFLEFKLSSVENYKKT